MFWQPSYMFTDKEHLGPSESSDELVNLSIAVHSADKAAPVQRARENGKDLLLINSEKEENSAAPGTDGSAYNAPLYDGSLTSAPSNPTLHHAKLATDYLLGLVDQSSSLTPVPSPPQLKLNPKVVLDPGTFQQHWRQLPVSLSQEHSMSPEGVAALTAPEALMRHMRGHSVQCIASGGQCPNFKFFFVAQKADEPSNFLVECIINTSLAKAVVKIKADDESSSESFYALMLSALSKFGVS